MINMKNSVTIYLTDLIDTHCILKDIPFQVPSEIIQKTENYERLRLSLLVWKMEKMFFDHYNGEEEQRLRKFFKNLKRRLDESDT